MAYTIEQWEQRINEAGNGWYEFVRWVVDGEYGALKKCVVRCLVDNYEWESSANNLVNTVRRCPHCANQRRWTAEERIEQINKLDNIEFVSWADGYKGANSKANVRCMKDGFEWDASVSNLVNHGSGCPQCSGKRRWTAEERVEQINKLHNIEFISWHGEYKNKKSKANVNCKVDGFVWGATVDDLVNNARGCPRCAKYGFKLDKTGYLYALRSECGMYLKVGISNDPKRRHKEIERGTPFRFNLVEQLSGDGAKIAELEKHFHSKYERAGFSGFDGATEWLICTPELLEELRELEDVK